MYHNIEEIYYRYEKEKAMEGILSNAKNNLKSIKKWIMDKIDELIIAVRKFLLNKTFKDKKVMVPVFVEEDLKKIELENQYILENINKEYDVNKGNSILTSIIDHTKILKDYIESHSYSYPVMKIFDDPNIILDALLLMKKSLHSYKCDAETKDTFIIKLYKRIIEYMEIILKYCKIFKKNAEHFKPHPTQTFHNAVEQGQVRKIRIMLSDSLLVDPSFELFKEMEKLASSVEGLYDKHNGRPFIENPEEWDDDYMDTLMVQVIGNFSHERVEHLKKVVRKLRPV